MTYSVRVERVCKSGVPFGVPQFYEVDSEIEAVTIAAYEVDANRSGSQRIASVFDPAGLLVLAYSGRAQDAFDAERG